MKNQINALSALFFILFSHPLWAAQNDCMISGQYTRFDQTAAMKLSFGLKNDQTLIDRVAIVNAIHSDNLKDLSPSDFALLEDMIDQGSASVARYSYASGAEQIELNFTKESLSPLLQDRLVIFYGTPPSKTIEVLKTLYIKYNDSTVKDLMPNCDPEAWI